MKIISKTILLCFILLACNNSKKMSENNKEAINTPTGDKIFFDKQGHRGCRGLMPENTIPAMLNAVGMGVTTLEMDIVFTKDRKAILSHEPFFNHEITTKPDGTFIDEKDEKNYNIYKMDYEEVKKYDVGMKPHPRFPRQEKMKVVKPLLSDVFAAVKQDMMTRRRPFPFYNIETKTTPATDDIFHPGPAEFVELLMQVIKENAMEDYVIIQSFDIRTLKYLHAHYPTIKTALLIDENDTRKLGEQLTELGFNPTIYSPHFSLATKSLIDQCKYLKIKVIPWTVNDKETIDKLKKMGFDGVITDYPNLFNE
ncbi:glycerophosphodiester phosphodiesterase family protein [soil metagenome]